MPFVVDCYNGFFRFTIIIFVTKRYALYKTAWIIDGTVNVNIIRRRYSRIIGCFSYCFQHGDGIVNPTCCLCHAALNLIPLFITVILLFIIYCSNLRYFTYNSSKYRLHLYLLMFCRSVPMQYIKNDEYQSR